MPRPLQRILTALLLLGVVVALEFGFETLLPDAAWRQLALFAMVNVIAALSLNVINGMAGQFSIGHAGFVGIGAYTGAVVAGNLHQHLGGGDPLFGNSFVVMPAALLASGLVAALFGLVVGLPSLRLRGDYLAIVTLGFAEIFRLTIATATTGGPDQGAIGRLLGALGGPIGYAGPDDTGVPQYAGPFWIFGAVVLATIVAWRLKFSGWGRALRALREDEIASGAVGVDPTRYKVTSFVISAAGGGIAGALLSSMRDGNPTVQPDQFTFNYSFDAITMVILGGSGSVSGAILGGVFVTFTVKLIEQLQGLDSVLALKAAYPALDLNALRMVIYAAILIGLMVLRPEGLFGERELFGRRWSRRRRFPVGPAEPVPATTGVEAGAGHDGAPPIPGAPPDEPPPGITVGREGKAAGRELE
ncbi:branched-chain amino acid ABC transporter permease [Sorangium sp. So ce426]|uniref:branched-chain amino acid ABC transporter permease n=1 Tax=Sorangium sp. So ce426 TaxID=3133312 RepID=UPI003F5C7D52